MEGGCGQLADWSTTVVKQLLDRRRDKRRQVSEVPRQSSRAPEVQAIEVVNEVLNAQDLTPDVVSCLIQDLTAVGASDVALAVHKAWIAAHGFGRSTLQLTNQALACCCAGYYSKQALHIWHQVKSTALPFDDLTASLVITSCSNAGLVDEAFVVMREALQAGLSPSTVTVAAIIQGCNYKRQGLYLPALQAFELLLQRAKPPPEAVLQALLDVCQAAIHKASSLGAALAVVQDLGAAGLARHEGIHTQLIRTCSRLRKWQEAVVAFEEMEAAGVRATTETFNSLILACVRGGQLEKALEVYEWMAAGRGTCGRAPVVAADLETHNILVRACHQAGMLEKALEVLTWLQGSGLDLSGATYDGLINTVEIAGLWDLKATTAAGFGAAARSLRTTSGAAAAAGGAGAPLPMTLHLEQLRPAPFDGMRMLYLEHAVQHPEEVVVAVQKLHQASWAPACMRVPVAKATELPPIAYSNSEMHMLAQSLHVGRPAWSLAAAVGGVCSVGPYSLHNRIGGGSGRW